MTMFQRVLDEDTPEIEFEIGNPHFSEKRAGISFRQLLAEVDSEYKRICDFAGRLSDEQLERKAHIPQMKDTPLGEYPTLKASIRGIGRYHVQFHIDQMREILAALSAK